MAIYLLTQVRAVRLVPEFGLLGDLQRLFIHEQLEAAAGTRETVEVMRTTLLRRALNPRIAAIPPDPSYTRLFLMTGLLPIAWYCGHYLDRAEIARKTKLRDKSALYKGLNPDPENNPSWGWKTNPYNFSEWPENLPKK